MLTFRQPIAGFVRAKLSAGNKARKIIKNIDTAKYSKSKTKNLFN